MSSARFHETRSIYPSKKLKNEIKKTIPFTTASKMKYLKINLTQEVQDLYNENYI